MDTSEHIAATYGDGTFEPERPADPPPPRGPRPKIRWIRLLALLSGLGVLAVISALFGMMMAVASDLPAIDVLDVPARQSYIVDRDGKNLGVLTGNQNRLLVRSDDIAPVMKHAIVSVEDRRFYTNSGVDIRAMGRALVEDVVNRSAVQGGSTIAQQLVKNRLEAQNDRTIFQKMREAAMAFHMTREWDKERILRNYLNTIYFGNGAYGIEAAARTYFGTELGVDGNAPQCGSERDQRRCAALLEPQQAALIAGVVANPTAYDPILHPRAARARRNLVLDRMREQGYVDQPQYETALREPLPTRDDIHPPQETSKYPYFTTWVRQQVVDKVGAGRAFEGGLKVQTTIDSELQQAAQAAVTQWLGPNPGVAGAPGAGVVVLDNTTSEVMAMVGGSNAAYNQRPFNLATQGQRQPGSAFKAFTLAEALEQGISPTSTWSSQKKTFCVTQKGKRCTESFEVNNYDDNYSGVTTLANATAFSDNSVFAEVGLQVGTKKVARLAHKLGVRTPISTNYAMTLGGLRKGVTVLDMAHAYESIANGGSLVYGSLSPGADRFEERKQRGTVPGPVGIRKISEPREAGSSKFRSAKLLTGESAVNRKRDERILSAATAASVESLLQGVVRIGSGKRAAVSGVSVAGKTGTTEDYGDAWFVGWSPKYTVAVWVGYPDSVKSMQPPLFSFNGEPVAGGTYPAAIFASFMRSALAIHPLTEEEGALPTPTPGATAPVPAGTAAPTESSTDPETAPEEEAPADPAPEAPPQQEAPAPAEPAPQEEPPQAPSGAPQGGAGAPTG